LVTLLDAGDDAALLFSDGSTQSAGLFSSGTLALTVHTGRNATCRQASRYAATG